MQAEMGPDIRVIEFFEDQVKNFEFRLGITPAILDASLVKDQQRTIEEKEKRARATRPELGDVDFLDLDADAPGSQPADLNFNPPVG